MDDINMLRDRVIAHVQSAGPGAVVLMAKELFGSRDSGVQAAMAVLRVPRSDTSRSTLPIGETCKDNGEPNPSQG